MGISVGTIFKWYNEDDSPNDGESCEDGQCVGIVTECAEEGKSLRPVVSVKWYDMCKYHAEVAEKETGPYTLSHIWQIGQLY